jgi:hypothetical protein
MPLTISAISEFLPSDPAQRVFAHAQIRNAIVTHRGYIFRCIGRPNQFKWVIWYVFVRFAGSWANFFKPWVAQISPRHSASNATWALDSACLPQWPCCVFFTCVPKSSIQGFSKRRILWNCISGTVQMCISALMWVSFGISLNLIWLTLLFRLSLI